jgi:DNA invertase Pin-like site-specific DNA recombinase
MEKDRQVIGYLRVSTQEQDLEKFKSSILLFANDKGFGNVQWVEEKVSGRVSWKERKIKDVVDTLQSGDVLIVPELSRLGRSTLEVLDILNVLKQKDVNVYSVKEGLSLNGDIQSKIMSTMLSLFSELERDFISARTKEALRVKKEQGVKLGRPKGKGKSKLDIHKDEIISFLKNGSTKKWVSGHYNTTPANLYHWMKMNKIKV